MVLVCHNTRQTRRRFIMIAITGATGQLGHLVIEQLLKTVPASQIVAIVRNPAKAQALSQQGIVVRQADYRDEAAFTAALSRSTDCSSWRMSSAACFSWVTNSTSSRSSMMVSMSAARSDSRTELDRPI